MRFALNLSTLLLVSSLIGLNTEAARLPSPSLEALCEGRKVKLRTLSHLNTLIEQLDSVGEKCSPLIRAALGHMKDLTEQSEAGVCTMEKALAITKFVDDYLRDSADSADSTKVKLPKSLEKFVIAYGMKVSGSCSKKMVSEFAYKADRRLRVGFGLKKDVVNGAGKMLLADADWRHEIRTFEKLLSNRSPLGMVLKPIIKPGELILPVDLMQTIPDMTKHIRQFVPKNLGLKTMKLICDRVYRPLYEPLLLPLAYLIRAGFTTKEFYWQKKYHDRGEFWSRVVFVCEIVKMIELNQEERADLSDQAEKTIVAEWNEALKDLKEEEEISDEKRAKLTTLSIGELSPSQIGDSIRDFSVRSLVKAFDANKNSVQLLRERILRRSLRVLLRMFQIRGFSAVVQNLRYIKKARGKSEIEFSEDELEAVKFEKVKSELIKLMHSPKRNSLAYEILIRGPNALRRILSGIVFTCIVILPLIVGEKIFRNHEGVKRRITGAIDFSYNWLHD